MDKLSNLDPMILLKILINQDLKMDLDLTQSLRAGKLLDENNNKKPKKKNQLNIFL